MRLAADQKGPSSPFHAGHCRAVLVRDLCGVAARAHIHCLFDSVKPLSIWSFSSPSCHCRHILVFVPVVRYISGFLLICYKIAVLALE